jgi:hypothetical protein
MESQAASSPAKARVKQSQPCPELATGRADLLRMKVFSNSEHVENFVFTFILGGAKRRLEGLQQA